MATARQRWNQLERRLWTAVRRGDLVDVRSEGTDPAHIWVPRAPSAPRSSANSCSPAPPLFRARSAACNWPRARITGALDLSHGRLDQPFAFLECWFDEPIDLSATRTQAVSSRTAACRGSTPTDCASTAN